MMTTFTIYPNLRISPNLKLNPYIKDFIAALDGHDGTSVINPPHKNPLLSILLPKRWGNVFIFNWFESIPDYKYGFIQSIAAILLINIIRLSGRDVVWMFHNRKPHTNGHTKMKQYLSRLIAKRSTLIVTHAKEGVDIINKNYPFAAHKVHFLDHPTKNRLPETPPSRSSIEYDVLIWGGIAKYKGTFEFVDFLNTHPDVDLKVCIVGDCSSDSLFQELINTVPANVTLIRQRPSFEELSEYAAKSHFILAPYSSETVLSSGMLMDSLSFGAKVIGPEVGSFKDYADEPSVKVYTFRDFGDIERIVTQKRDEPLSLKSYNEFLNKNKWSNFATELLQLLSVKS